MKQINKILIASIALFTLSCNDDFDAPVDEVIISSGNADFTTYVALGNSLTAGYADNALYVSGQQNAYPAIIANQMLAANGGEFIQPLMPDDIGGFADLGITGKLVLNESLQLLETPAQSNFDNIAGLYNNMGIPGAKSFHLGLSGYGNAAGLAAGAANPYYVRMAANPTSTVISDAIAQNPTFFTYWIGNNDILGYATSGGVSNNNDCVPSATQPCNNAITNTTFFTQVITQQIQALTAGGAKGAVANIPSVTSIPYFTTVPYDALDADNNADFATQVPTLNALAAGLNQVFDLINEPNRKITFNPTGTSAVLVHDESLVDRSAEITQILSQSPDPQIAALAPIYGMQFGQSRQATSDDLVVLVASSAIGQINTDRVAELIGLGLPQEVAGQLSVNGITYPLADRYVLLPSEQQAIESARQSYNATISTLASQYDLAYVDAATRLEELESQKGITYNGVNYSANFISGGAFSLDGVHPTARGYAIVANEFVKAINNKYNSNLREVNPNTYPGLMLP